MATLLARKAGTETPIATDDDHHEALAADPAVSSFPTGSSFGGSNGFNSTAGSFGTPATSSGSNFGSTPSAGGFGSTPTNAGFGSTGATAMPAANNNNNLASPGGAMSQGGESTVALDKDATDWINKKWRPVMGWVYMMTCTCDFVLFPVLWSLLQALTHGNVTSQWQPLTLQGAGLYHIAMGAVLGIAAYGRTKEKIEGASK